MSTIYSDLVTIAYVMAILVVLIFGARVLRNRVLSHDPDMRRMREQISADMEVMGDLLSELETCPDTYQTMPPALRAKLARTHLMGVSLQASLQKTR